LRRRTGDLCRDCWDVDPGWPQRLDGKG